MMMMMMMWCAVELLVWKEVVNKNQTAHDWGFVELFTERSFVIGVNVCWFVSQHRRHAWCRLNANILNVWQPYVTSVVFVCGVISSLSVECPQTHPKKCPPEAHCGASVRATHPGSAGHQLRQTLGQPWSGGHPVPAKLSENAGVSHQWGQPLQQDQRQAGGQRQR